MVIYDSAYIYVDSCTSVKEKITRIDAIITALEDTALKSAANDDIKEVNLDDGQTKIRTEYKGTDAVLKSIEGFIKLKNYYVNKLNGRVTRLVDSKSFRM